ncbi:putative ABC transporter permease subunit [Massilia sp. S19_KUP03_FR1]|uniref:putative ABC transporter permease subunit n=1 Tax=Massilia sp. S19_KUP03_FR1 TaxID=3025503 RepID=UPI002FCD2992
MRGRPGSAWWLLQHELRMFWFNNGGRSKKRSWVPPLLAIGWLALHGMAFSILHTMPALPEDALAIAAMAATALMVVLGTFMFSSGLKASVDSLFERGDVDLLLSSPLPSRSIFTVRLGAVTLGVASVYLALAGPVINVGVFLGHVSWLAVYAVILAWATICSALAMLLTLLLVRLIGARKTRVVAQVISAIAGALIFLLAQAQNIFQLYSAESIQGATQDLLAPGGVLSPDSVVWSAGRAALGGMVPLLALVAIAVAVFLFTVHFTHHFFVHGLQQSVSKVRAQRPPATVRDGQFGRHLLEVVLRKEWKLIARDPHLVSQVLLQLLYLLPLGFVVLRSEQQIAPGIAAGLAIIAASLTASLTWIIVAAEDAPDLLQASPAAARTIRLAKLGAALIPPLALMIVPLAWALAQHLVTGLLMCFTVVAACAGAALTGLWQGRPAPRGQFKTRGKTQLLATLLEMMGSAGWAGTGFLLIRAAAPGQNAYDARWAGITLAVALLALLLAWGTRHRAG